jgi:xylulokinase
MDVVLALDLGSTWLKGGLVDLDGKLLHLERVSSPLQGEGPLDAEDIWQATVGLLRRLCKQAGPDAAPLAVSITGATRSHVFLDAQQRPFEPVMLWDDPAGSELGERVSRAYGFTGDTPGFGAYHPLARILRIGQDRGAMPHRLVELKDWLNYRLTGRLATDAVACGRHPGAAGTAPDSHSALRAASQHTGPDRGWGQGGCERQGRWRQPWPAFRHTRCRWQFRYLGILPGHGSDA